MSSNKIDEIVNIAYKTFFNPSKKNYATKAILIKEALKDNELWKFDRESEQSDALLESLFNEELTFINGTCDRLIFSRKNSENDNKSLVSIYLYKNTSDVDSLNSNININAINKFILYTNSGKRSYVTLPIQNFDASTKKVQEKLSNFSEANKIFKKCKSPIVSIQITENFYNLGNLEEILKKISEDDLIILLLSVLYALYFHQRKYPELRLNFDDLTSFLTYEKPKQDRKFHYFVNNIHYLVPDNGLQLRFHDLRNSVIHPDLENKSLSAKTKKYTQTDDLLNLLTLLKNGVKTTNKKIIDGLMKDIKKDNLNAENILLNYNLFSKFKETKPDVPSENDNEPVDNNNQ